MLFKKTFSFFVSALVLLSAAGSTLACACCVERGHYSRSRVKMTSYLTAMIGDIKIAGPADLYMTEAGFDMIKGLPEIEKYDAEGGIPQFSITSSFDRKIWRLNVQAASGRSGTLVMPMPTHMTMHAADIDGIDNGLGVSLYKEYSLYGRISTGTGIFRSARAANYHIMFQGRGNGCDDASDFARWRLEISGPRAEYAFFGTTQSTGAPSGEAKVLHP